MAIMEPQTFGQPVPVPRSAAVREHIHTLETHYLAPSSYSLTGSVSPEAFI